MGCGGSKEEEKPRKANEGKYEKDDAPPAVAAGQQEHDADLEDDPASHSPLARKESAAVNASEPGDFVAKMKSAYQVRKAKFNGANEDVDQYADEIQDSIPVLARREKARIQEWVNDVGAANPGDVFDDMPADGKQQRRASAVTASSEGNYLRTADNASDSVSLAEPKSPLGLGKQSSSVAAVQSETTQPALDSEAGSPKKQPSDAVAGDDAPLPGQVPDQPSGNGDAVPLVHVTSGSTAGFNNPRPERRPSEGMVATMSGLEVSEGASANPEDATHSQGVLTDESDVVEGGDFKFN